MEGTTGKVKAGGKLESGVVRRADPQSLDVELLTGKARGQVITVKPEHFSAGQLPGEKQAGKSRRTKN